MTNKNRTSVIRAYMAAHGVNYTTAMRALDEQRRTGLQVVAESPERAPYGHPDYEPADTAWEDLTYLAEDANRTGKWANWASEALGYRIDALIGEQERRIPDFLDTLTTRLTPATSALLDRAAIEAEARATLKEGFDEYWDTAAYDEGYPAHATIDIAAGVIAWLDPTTGSPTANKDLHQKVTQLTASLSQTLDREPTVEELAGLLHVTPESVRDLTARQPDLTRPIAHATTQTAHAELGRAIATLPSVFDDAALGETPNWHIVHRTAEEMPDDQRTVYLFAHVAGFDNYTLAAILGLTEQRVRDLRQSAHGIEMLNQIHYPNPVPRHRPNEVPIESRMRAAVDADPPRSVSLTERDR